MARLDCKPHLRPDRRSNSNIWFCAHPEDMEEYFDSISNDILKKCEKKHTDVAVWFDREPLEPYDEASLLSYLSQMRLVIVAITKKFLTEDNRARLVELKYAAENKKPILPLMLESGLDRLFDEVCGSIQYLAPFINDGTAISYGDKLSSFLSSIFIDDASKKRIENEFDTTIFLSYRKKDRAHAQELMEIIHRNDKFRDVAIWYDEFLTPGEDYNHSISDAIKKSRAFVMTVTPSILEKSVDKDGNLCENYIVSTEYPLAYTLEKPIIPYEIVHTGMRIHTKFPDLPYYIPEGCIDELYKDLAFKLSDISLGAKRGDPEHDYLIGLAYLTGTCVEQNKDKGIALITSAAQNGHLEAMSRLSRIYALGDGVEKSDSKKLEWENKITDRYKSLLDNAESLSREQTERYLDAYIRSILSSNHTMIFNELSLFIEVRIKEVRALYDKLKDITPKSNELLHTVYGIYSAYGALGKDLKTKLMFSLRALDIAEEFVNADESRSNVFALSETLLTVSQIHLRNKNYQKAEEYCSRALETAEKAVNMNGSIKMYMLNTYHYSADSSSRRHYMKCCADYAKINIMLGNMEKAAEYYRKHLDSADLLLKEGDEKMAMMHYADASSALMSYAMMKKDTSAKDYYLKTLGALDMIPPKAFRNDLTDSIVFMRLGAYLEEALDFSGAENHYIKALKCYVIPVENMTSRALVTVIMILRRLAEVSKKLGSPSLAKNYSDQANYYQNEYMIRASGATPDAELSSLNSEIFFIPNDSAQDFSNGIQRTAQNTAWSHLCQSAQSYIKSGEIHLSVGNREKAKEYFEKSVTVLKDLCEQAPGEERYAEALRDAQSKLFSADEFVAKPEPKTKRSLFSIFKRK